LTKVANIIFKQSVTHIVTKGILNMKIRKEYWPKAAPAIDAVQEVMKKRVGIFLQGLAKKVKEGNSFEAKFIFPVERLVYTINP
jgi:hypothetical protein